ncbi:MAG: hypothetical protein LBC82_04925 [Oscillospiraceae bacterium]|jgi:hypothetical protein|nr:hypothetical protein [Oscillospiraceae bacterium]
MVVAVDLLMEKFNHLEDLLSDFGRLSGRLSSADFELVDETQGILDEREKIIGQIKIIQSQITEILEKQPPAQAAKIRKMLTGENVTADYSEDEKNIQVKIIGIHSLQSDIMQKESGTRIRFKKKYDDVRSELEELQKEKKKLNFYQNARVEVKGDAFDNQS